MHRLLSLPVVAFAVLASCTNSSVPHDWQRSGVVGEGRRPMGLPGQPVEPAARAGSRTAAATQAAAEAATIDARVLPVLDGATGSPLGWFEFVSTASQADVIILGEVHGDPAAQAFLSTFWEDLTPMASGAWLALEFFERDQQTALDDYLAGVTSEEEFRRATGRTGTNYPPGHRAMVERAKMLGRPVIAANAPRRYARLARTAGFERLQSLPPDTQRLFVVPGALTEGRYRTEFESMMRESLEQGAHTASERKESADAAKQGDTTAEPESIDEKVAGYYRSQNLWDATMADAVTRPVLAGGRPVVLVVGQFHSDFGGGLAERVRAAAPGARVMTVSLVDERAPGGTLRSEDAGRADVVVYLR